MQKTTFAQLPGLQKAKQILELQEQISTHTRYCTQLLEVFNELHFQASHQQNKSYVLLADQVQVICEWHMTQRIYLESQLNDLQRTS